MALKFLEIVLVIVALALAFGIGSNDETFATPIGSKSITLKVALILGGTLTFVGVVWLASGVGKTIGKSMLGTEAQVDYASPSGIYMMLAIIISTTIWLVVASRTGAPISTTHSVVGSILGIAIVWSIITPGASFIDALNWGKMGQVLLGWVISPLFGYFGAIGFQTIVQKFMKTRSKGLIQLEETEKSFTWILVIAVCWTQISRGGNDAANALGVLYGVFAPGEGDILPFYVLVMVAIMMIFGLVIIGRNVLIQTGGLVEMRPSDAFAVSISTTIVLFICTILGLPVSGSHILIFAILGSGKVKGERPDKKSFDKMVKSWVLTFPVAASLSALIYVCFLPFI